MQKKAELSKPAAHGRLFDWLAHFDTAYRKRVGEYLFPDEKPSEAVSF